MDGLDFGQLTDDQLVALFRAVCQEAAARNPAVRAAVQSAALDEAEKARIAADAAEREAAAQRARERQRVAEEATAKVKEQAAALDGDRIARNATAKIEAKKDVLRTFARLVDRHPADITVVMLGGRLLVNDGGNNRYGKEHLVDVRDGDDIRTVRDLVGRKPSLLAAATALRAKWQTNWWLADEYDWTNEQPAPAPAGATTP